MIKIYIYRWGGKLRIVNLRRFWNLVKIVVGHYYARFWGVIRLQFPYAISLELASVCNLKCPQCPVGLGLVKRRRAFIDKNLAFEIIDEFSLYGIILNLYFQGESLLCPYIREITEYAVNKQLFTILSTNAHFLNQETANSVVKSGMHRVIVSVDGYEQDSYAHYREGGNLELVWNGLRLLVDARKSANSVWPEIFVQTVVNKYNEQSLNKIKLKAMRLGADKVLFKTMQVYKNHDDWLPLNKKFSRYEGYRIIKRPNKKCFRAFSSMVITSDGMYVPCCFDKFASYVFNENILKFEDIALSSNRELFLSRIYKSWEMHSICSNCTESKHIYKRS